MVTQQHGEFVFLEGAEIDNNRVILPEEEQHHLIRVRRVRTGDTIFATDGTGRVYKCILKSESELEVQETLVEFGETTVNYQLICGCLQGDTAKDVVSAAVQLGVRRLTWVRMMRSQEFYSDNKLSKLRRVAVQATKQAGRARLIEQERVGALEEALQVCANCDIWVAHPGEAMGEARSAIHPARIQMLIVGPEGGFDTRELELMRSCGATFIQLGSRRLRSETAVTAGIVYLQSTFRDL